ncbi:MarR family winged helix-turn-helix transcriptional regulator [Streptomyces sp. TP-A0874]|uniref:MarR family winged helix-turn-helix transcriptional regulator n=1 Tax=Streptomyces sp. TP-A0874 TaxID=549819 RepID=UPI0008538EBC|nr:MarR family transcriptional regulator [Streptomyces sp. TP-A0874]
MPKPLSLPFDPIARADELWKQRWGSVPAMAAITSIMRAQQILLGQVDAVVKPYGLTFARYEALVLLTFSKEGELPMSKIGERLMVHPTSVTNTVDRLVRSGLVEKRPNPNDGRGVLAAITDRGRGVVESATRDLMAMDFGLSVYDAEECGEIFAMLRPLRVAAQDFEETGDPGGHRESGAWG